MLKTMGFQYCMDGAFMLAGMFYARQYLHGEAMPRVKILSPAFRIVAATDLDQTWRVAASHDVQMRHHGPLPFDSQRNVAQQTISNLFVTARPHTSDNLDASLRPAPNARDASSAAEVRQAFFDSCAGSVPKKEVGLRLARKGFAEESANFWSGVARTKRRVYRYNFPDSAGAFVALLTRPGP